MYFTYAERKTIGEQLTAAGGAEYVSLRYKCPECGIGKGETCVYADNDGNRRYGRVGLPTKRAHHKRMDLAWQTELRRRRKGEKARIVPAPPDLRAAFRAEAQFEMNERTQLAIWFSAYGHIFEKG